MGKNYDTFSTLQISGIGTEHNWCSTFYNARVVTSTKRFCRREPIHILQNVKGTLFMSTKHNFRKAPAMLEIPWPISVQRYLKY